tara:strand:+ start:184 stop:1116 length:933 start_codon:yes stop_codon:yes gene_type:complete
MNEALRILDKLLKKGGYTIKKHSEHNLLPLKNFKNNPFLLNTYEAFNKKHKIIHNDDVSQLNICLRTCINKKRAGHNNELTGIAMDTHLLKCIHSLIISINQAVSNNKKIKLTVFDDRSDSASLKMINNLLNMVTCDWEIIQTKSTGQGNSLYEHFSFARNKNSLFYFCEDDYLHIPDAINEMINFYMGIFKETSTHLLIHPQEHELVYSQINYPSYILEGKKRRWRTISHATHTFFTHSSIVDKYWEYFYNTRYVGHKEKRHLGSEKQTTDKLFNHVPGFSPIPAVAVHLQSQASLPPFFDWKSWWNNI